MGRPSFASRARLCVARSLSAHQHTAPGRGTSITAPLPSVLGSERFSGTWPPLCLRLWTLADMGRLRGPQGSNLGSPCSVRACSPRLTWKKSAGLSSSMKPYPSMSSSFDLNP